MISIVTSRFNNDTWRENLEYRKTHNIKGCIYCSPQQISSKIYSNSPIFVVEMNNTTNKIQGIGIVKNTPVTNKYFKIYNDANYNRYVYISDFRLDREILLHYDKDLVYILETMLFKCKTHLKRGYAFTTITEKVLGYNICKNINIKKEIQNIFKNHYVREIGNTTERQEENTENAKREEM
jgi:hypothetical protein